MLFKAISAPIDKWKMRNGIFEVAPDQGANSMQPQPDTEAHNPESPDLRRKRWRTPLSNRSFELRMRFLEKKRMEEMRKASREMRRGRRPPPS